KKIVKISDEMKKQNNKEIEDLICIEEIITSLFYIEKNKKKEILFTEKCKLFSTIPTLLNKNFTVVFDSEDIKSLHKQFLSTLIKRKYANGSTVETLKNALSDKFEEKELANYFPFLIQENEVDDKSIKLMKQSKLSS
ncbi:hypothetical protein, partial [Enterobacter hormaechei]|uniref:hypothetical protein n=1 Tax=Enterobacter hormaechei TaxID=158836 RepID=UPI00159715F4